MKPYFFWSKLLRASIQNTSVFDLFHTTAAILHISTHHPLVDLLKWQSALMVVTRPVTKGSAGGIRPSEKIFATPLKKCVGHSLKYCILIVLINVMQL